MALCAAWPYAQGCEVVAERQAAAAAAAAAASEVVEIGRKVAFGVQCSPLDGHAALSLRLLIGLGVRAEYVPALPALAAPLQVHQQALEQHLHFAKCHRSGQLGLHDCTQVVGQWVEEAEL